MIILVDERLQKPFQMTLAQHDHMVKELSPQRSDRSLDERILPKTSIGGTYFCGATSVQKGSYAGAVEAVNGDYAASGRQYQEALAKIEQLQAQLAGGQPKLDLAQIPSTGTCWTCFWLSGKICQRHGSPNFHKHVSPLDEYDLQKHTKLPRGELISVCREVLTA